MITKTIEVRDKGTFIPMLAIQLSPWNEADRYLLARAGYGGTKEEQSRYVLLARIDGGEGKIQCDPYEWGTSARTVPEAHRWLIEHFNEIPTGFVLDVEYILHETSKRKVSEAIENPDLTSP